MIPDNTLPEQVSRHLKTSLPKPGKLKIFFGACAGAGKTYDMLSAAQEKIKENLDVLAGIIETHGRTETGKLLAGIPRLPLKEWEYQGITVKEFDLDSALKKKPDIILVDELAHSNLPGSRHPKRWQDIQELLSAGIDVYTTLNVQHLESLNDTIANLTGIQVKETIPDSIFDSADEIILVDIPSEIILERLQEGKVYLGEFAKQRAAQNFFKIENLIALRELALRRTAERVDALRDIYQKYQVGHKKAAITDKVLVCINANPNSTKLIRTAKQQATKLKCSWTALYVEDEQHYYLNDDEKSVIQKSLQLAEQLGGDTQVIINATRFQGIINYFQDNNFTRLVIGKTIQSNWKNKLTPPLINRIINASDILDVYVIGKDPLPKPAKASSTSNRSWLKYANAVVIVGLCTAISLPFKGWLEPENAIMIYLAGLVFISVIEDRICALFTALLSVLCYSLIFAHPNYSLNFSDYNIRDAMTLIIFIFVSILISGFTSKLRSQNLSARKREKYTSHLYDLSRKLLTTSGKNRIARVVADHISDTFNCAVTVWLPDSNGLLTLASHPGIKAELKEESVAQWTFQHNQDAGMGTDTMPSARGYYLPIGTQDSVYGVVGIIPKDPNHVFSSEEVLMMEALALQAAFALERIKTAEQIQKAKAQKSN